MKKYSVKEILELLPDEATKIESFGGDLSDDFLKGVKEGYNAFRKKLLSKLQPN